MHSHRDDLCVNNYVFQFKNTKQCEKNSILSLAVITAYNFMAAVCFIQFVLERILVFQNMVTHTNLWQYVEKF